MGRTNQLIPGVLMRIRGKRISVAIGVGAIMLAAISPSANAQAGAPPLLLANIADNTQLSTADFQAGNQGFAPLQNGVFEFAGHNVTLTDFQGIFGMSSDLAYIMVSSGSASIGDDVAKAGRIFMIPPFGDKIAVERFDAAMFLRSLSEQSKAGQPEMVAALSNIASGQKRGKFWGTLRPTGRNVNALRSVAKEKIRRELLDNKAMQQVRFSGLADGKAAAEQTIQTFISALIAKDVASVAALLDPMQFGGAAMRGGGKAARELAAQGLVGSYQPATNDVSAGSDEDSWIITTRSGRRTVKLRRIDDLYFVQSIS